jgi:hypothetical protein
MSEEFNLSNDIEESPCPCGCDITIKTLRVSEVKEFIRLLKEDIRNANHNREGTIMFIDKLAGERLK